MKVYVSHTGIQDWGYLFESEKETLCELLEEMNDSGQFNRIYNIVMEDGKF